MCSYLCDPTDFPWALQPSEAGEINLKSNYVQIIQLAHEFSKRCAIWDISTIWRSIHITRAIIMHFLSKRKLSSEFLMGVGGKRGHKNIGRVWKITPQQRRNFQVAKQIMCNLEGGRFSFSSKNPQSPTFCVFVNLAHR